METNDGDEFEFEFCTSWEPAAVESLGSVFTVVCEQSRDVVGRLLVLVRRLLGCRGRGERTPGDYCVWQTEGLSSGLV